MGFRAGRRGCIFEAPEGFGDRGGSGCDGVVAESEAVGTILGFDPRGVGVLSLAIYEEDAAYGG